MASTNIQSPPAVNPELLMALTRPDGGRVVLVVGAGCSYESPTSLPLAQTLSADLHQQLVRHGTLNDGDCSDENDLSCLADTVIQKTGGQRAMVDCMPRTDFQVAEPNAGYLMAAALLREQAVACVLTLNFDLAMTSALRVLGASDVGVVNGPQDHHHMQTKNLIYLHRNIEADPEALVLTTDALERAWQGEWEQIVVQRFVSSPVTVFAGLGSPAEVLVHCVTKIREKLPDQTLVIQVDPAPHGSSPFSRALDISADCYSEMGWSRFMEVLASTLMDKWSGELSAACLELSKIHGWEDEDVTTLLAEMSRIGMVDAGKARAHWLFNRGPYLPWRDSNLEWIADLLLLVRIVERETASSATINSDGTIEFRSSGGQLGVLGVAHGRGARSWSALEPEVQRKYGERATPLSGVIVTGFNGVPTASSPPGSIAYDATAGSIVDAESLVEMIDGSVLRSNPQAAVGSW